MNYLLEDARAVAVSLLDRYNSYLKVFEEELPCSARVAHK